MPTLHSFLRVSTPEQALGTGDKRQIEKGRKWAAENGWDFGEVFRAETRAFRGKHRRIGGLKIFLDMVQAGKISRQDGLWVENFDRLNREPTFDALGFFRDIIETGITLVVRGQPYTREILRLNKGLWHEIVGECNRANEESERKSEAVLASYEIRRQIALTRKTPITGRNCPGWLEYKCEPGKHVWEGRYDTIPTRVSIVQQIFAWAASGMGCKDIALRLNDPECRVESFRPRLRNPR